MLKIDYKYKGYTIKSFKGHYIIYDNNNIDCAEVDSYEDAKYTIDNDFNDNDNDNDNNKDIV